MRIDIADQFEDDTSIQSESGCARSEIFEDEILPEAICDFNVVVPATTCTATLYEESDVVIHNDRTYTMSWQNVQEISTQTNSIPTDEKGVLCKTDSGDLSLYTGVSNQVFLLWLM